MRRFALLSLPVLAVVAFLAAGPAPPAVVGGPGDPVAPPGAVVAAPAPPAAGPPPAPVPGAGGKQDVKKGAAEDDNEDAKLNRWFVYRDGDSAENNSQWTNFMESDLIKGFRLVDKAEPAFGASCIKVSVKFQPPNWCGIATSCEANYWGETPSDAAYNLKAASKLVFYARGDKGGESIQVKLAIAGDKKFGDSAKIAPATRWITLKKTWERFELPIDARKTNLERVVTPFCVITNKDHNAADDVTFFLDHIYYVMEGKR